MKYPGFKIMILAASLTAAFQTAAGTISYASAVEEQEGGPGYVNSENALMMTDITVVADTDQTITTVVTVPWSDDWFTAPSTVYSPDLALTSAALAGTTYFKDENGAPSAFLAESAFRDLGFDPETIRSYNYDYPYTEKDNNVVAFTLAAKKIGDTSLVAAVARGTSIKDEWVSNMQILETGNPSQTPVDHYGFFETADDVYATLCDYLEFLVNSGKDYSYDNIIFYVTGHSRGGAIADILAAKLDDLYGKENVFAYPVAVPAVSARATKEGYENIFNIMGEKDDVVLDAFKEIGFKRFGEDVMIPADNASGAYTMHSPTTYCELLAQENLLQKEGINHE